MDKTQAIVILGTAHLGTTPGKCSPDKAFREAVYSREIVDRVEKELRAKGYTVYVDYKPLEPNAQIKSSYWKTEQNRELNYRSNYVNSLCKKFGTSRCIYVSIHVNAFGNQGKWEDKRGWCVYTSPGKTKADDLATSIWNVADRWIPKDNKTAIRADWSDKDPDFEAAFHVLTKTKCPACLTENLFQDNKADVAYLTSEEGKATITRIHVEGIINYLASV